MLQYFPEQLLKTFSAGLSYLAGPSPCSQESTVGQTQFAVSNRFLFNQLSQRITLLQKLIDLCLVNKFLAFYGTWRFVCLWSTAAQLLTMKSTKVAGSFGQGTLNWDHDILCNCMSVGAGLWRDVLECETVCSSSCQLPSNLQDRSSASPFSLLLVK